MDGSFGKKDLLLLLAVILSLSEAHITCHCLNGTECHSNRYCAHGCENGWFGPGCQLRNVAQSKETRQSSTFYDYGMWYNASRAVDGVYPNCLAQDGNNAIHCSHTTPQNISSSAWWLVILGTTQSYVITNVTIINRNDRAAQRLTNFVIMYSNEVEGDPALNESIWHEFAREMDAVGNKKTYTSRSTAVAKRVAVYLTAQNETGHEGNPKAILTLCEVEIYGYQHYDCPNGFTGPGCLLRSCDACESTGGRCAEEYGSCRYDVCPDRSLLPPDCWITLSNYSEVDIRTTATCNSLLFSIYLPNTKPNVAASLLHLQVNKSVDRQIVVNTTLSVQGTSATLFKFDDADMDTLYEVSVKPVYCNTANDPCFYATPSKVFTVRTGRREYVFSHNNSCVVVTMKSAIAACEVTSAIQVTCESKGITSGTVNSSRLTACGLEKGKGYNCSVSAVIKARTIEKQSADIFIEPLDASPNQEKEMTVVSASIGASIAVHLFIATGIIVFVYCRRQQNSKSGASAVAYNAKASADVQASALDMTMLPTSYEEQNGNTNESYDAEPGCHSTGDYVNLPFVI